MESAARNESREGSKKNLACTLCSKTFHKKDHLDAHIRAHTKEKGFKCDRCDFATAHSKSLRVHRAVHEPTSRNLKYKCNFCDHNAASPKDLQRHYATHTGEKPFACTAVKDCPYRSARKSDLVRHLKNHEEAYETARMYACKVCRYRTKFQHNLKTHERTHNDRILFVCDEAGCDFRSNWLKNLTRHKLSHFPDVDSSLLSCPKAGCLFVTSRQTSMKVHLEAHDGVRKHNCESCDYSAKSNWDLTKHVRNKHTAGRVKTVTCPLCPKLFFTSGNLKQHMYTHTKEKPFRCSDVNCGYATHHPSKLRRHQKAVHSVKK